tara:strand:+ start:868 stop:1710 length:843 start_codon:yes stop_codon:yes gene_type:complete
MVRIIPKLDIKGPDLVKGIHLEGLRVLGTPESFAKYYYDEGADEIIFQDVVASLFERNSLHEIISRTAKNIFIPISVGGGIRTVKDISSVLRSGADRVTLNTIAVRKPSFIEESVKCFGSSTIVLAVEAIKEEDGMYRAFVDNGREYTGLEVSDWVKRVENLGVGEIIITSVDNEGTGRGFDIELLNLIRKNTSISIIAHGGAGNIENIKEAINTGVNGLALSSCLHYEAINKINRNDVKNNFEGNNLFLKSGMKRKINTLTIRQIKECLNNNNINIRPV